MSYLPNQYLAYRDKNKIKVLCDFCNNEFQLMYMGAEKNKKRNNGHKCSICSGHPIKPQQTSDYWTKDKKIIHSQSVKNSDKYKKAISIRDTSGKNNGMFGKKASDATKLKMSKSRTGKIGKNATAWKGGKNSLNKRVKGFLHKNIQWYKNVYKRDKWKCIKCKSKKKLDAHHIEPISKIIKRLLEHQDFQNDDDKLLWLCKQKDIIDIKLNNGITLCRECHKKEHNWGSHNA